MASTGQPGGSAPYRASGLSRTFVPAPPAVWSGEPGSADAARGRLTRWLSAVFSFPTMLAVLLFSLIFSLARLSIADPDIWWHLRNAENLWKTHQFLRYDFYSFTVPGHAWINTEWLAEIPYYMAWRVGGLTGIEVLTIAIISLVVFLLLYLSFRESGDIKSSFVACCFAILLASVSFGPRTILLGYACMVGLLILLQRFRREGRAPLWLVPILFCVWANTHGSWFLGLIVYSIVVAAGMVRGTWGRVDAVSWSAPELRKLIFTGLASVAAVFVNPYGTALVMYPLDLAFRQKLNVAHIAEWVSVDFHDARGRLVLTFVLCLLLGALVRTARWTLTEVALLAFGLYCGLTYVRFLVLLAILSAPTLAQILKFLPPYRREIDKPLMNALIILLLVVGVVRYRPTSAELSRAVSQQYPARALSFLAAHPPDGPMLNYYLWGGYLGWNDRSVKIFVDSRVDIFEYSGVFKDYLDLLALDQPQRILDKYNIHYVLFPPGEALTFALEHDPKWKVVYQDEISVLLQRMDEPAN